MKTRKMRLVLALILTLCISTMNGVAVGQAEEMKNSVDEIKQLQMVKELVAGENYALGIVTEDGLIVLEGNTARATQKGYIIGDGVRLRKAPKSTATVLELMSKNETVLIDYAASSDGCSSGKWFYVKRVKTGTWGWVHGDYLAA